MKPERPWHPSSCRLVRAPQAATPSSPLSFRLSFFSRFFCALISLSLASRSVPPTAPDGSGEAVADVEVEAEFNDKSSLARFAPPTGVPGSDLTAAGFERFFSDFTPVLVGTDPEPDADANAEVVARSCSAAVDGFRLCFFSPEADAEGIAGLTSITAEPGGGPGRDEEEEEGRAGRSGV